MIGLLAVLHFFYKKDAYVVPCLFITIHDQLSCSGTIPIKLL